MTDFDPIGKHDKPDDGMSEWPDENIPLTPGGGVMGRPTWGPERKQETSFGGMTLREEVLNEHVKGVY